MKNILDEINGRLDTAEEISEDIAIEKKKNFNKMKRKTFFKTNSDSVNLGQFQARYLIYV